MLGWESESLAIGLETYGYLSVQAFRGKNKTHMGRPFLFSRDSLILIMFKFRRSKQHINVHLHLPNSRSKPHVMR